MTQFFDLSPRGSQEVSPQSKCRSATQCSNAGKATGPEDSSRMVDEFHAPFLDPSPIKFEAEARLAAVRDLTRQNFSTGTAPSSKSFQEASEREMNEESLPPRTPRNSKEPHGKPSSQSSSLAQTPTQTPAGSRDRTPSATPRRGDRSYSVPSRYMHFTDARRDVSGTPKRIRQISSEDLEMGEIERKREEVRNLRKFNEKTYRKALLGVGISVGTGSENSRGLTVPKEFCLSTCSARSFERERDSHTCRSNWDTSIRTPRKTTSPMPFASKHETEQRGTPSKRSVSEPPEDYSSVGQRSVNSKDRSTTPSRQRWSPHLTIPQGPSMLDRPSTFRSRDSSREKHQEEMSIVSNAASYKSATSNWEESIDRSRRRCRWTNKLTEAEPFILSSSVRSVSVKSREELEEEQMQAIRSKPFRARPVPRSCKEPSGIPFVDKRPLTVPHDFSLSVSNSERSLSRSRKENSASEDSRPSTPFKARKIPAGILDGPAFVLKSAEVPLTCPESPSMLSEERSIPCDKRDLSVDSQGSKTFRAREMPDFEKLCFKPSLSTQNLTTPVAPVLSTDARGALHRARLEKKLLEAEMEEASKRDFRAQPIAQTAPLQEFRPQQVRTPKKDRDFEMMKSPNKNLDIIATYAERAERAQQEARQAVDQQQQIPVFRSRPCPATTYHRGRLPEVMKRTLTMPTDSELHSSVRSKSREMYDRERSQRLSEAEEQKQIFEQEQSAQEEREVRSIRKSQEFKAKPLPNTTYEPGKLPEKQLRHLTVPVEPQVLVRTPRPVREDSSDKENSVEPNQYDEPPAWRSARSALRKVQN